MALCTLDLNHPYFQNSIGNYDDDLNFHEGLIALKAKIEAEHTSCNHAVQQMPGYPDCQNKIWKYDWSPVGQHSASRKAWRMIVIVADPNASPLYLIAAAVYSKSGTKQLSAKQLAKILAGITKPFAEPLQGEVERFRQIVRGDGVFVSVCLECGETVAESQTPLDLLDREKQHECPGPITVQPSN